MVVTESRTYTNEADKGPGDILIASQDVGNELHGANNSDYAADKQSQFARLRNKAQGQIQSEMSLPRPGSIDKVRDEEA